MSTLEKTKRQEAEKIVSAITNVSKEIDKDLDNAKATFKASSVLKNGLRADIDIRDFKLVSDEPESLGGNDEGPNPVEIILGAFASCQEIVIKAYASVLDITVDKIEIEVSGDLDLRGFFNLAEVRPGYENISFKTTIVTDETDGEKLENLKYFAVEKCPVMDILENPVPVEGEITYTKPS